MKQEFHARIQLDITPLVTAHFAATPLVYLTSRPIWGSVLESGVPQLFTGFRGHGAALRFALWPLA